ncbi:hypothetical protein ACS5PN_27005 [Roseateles sp. NT4]
MKFIRKAALTCTIGAMSISPSFAWASVGWDSIPIPPLCKFIGNPCPTPR